MTSLREQKRHNNLDLRLLLVTKVFPETAAPALCPPFPFLLQIMGEPPFNGLNGAAVPVALPLDEVGAIRGGVSATVLSIVQFVILE